MGKINTVLPDHQYQIRVDGSGRITFRSYHFLKKCKIKAAPTPIPSTTPVPITSTCHALLLHPNHPISSSNDTCTAIKPPKRPHIYQYAFSCQKFLVFCPDYYHITGQALKKGTALVQLCSHTGWGDVEVTALMRRMTITLTGSVTTSIQLADKNKTSCNTTC